MPIDGRPNQGDVMANTNERNGYRIEWDLHEFGERPAAQPRALHGPKDPERLAFARALAAGDVPANAPQMKQERAA
jgi:hypothetical protein